MLVPSRRRRIKLNWIWFKAILGLLFRFITFIYISIYNIIICVIRMNYTIKIE